MHLVSLTNTAGTTEREPDSNELFEIIRAEISARGVCRRHLLLNRLHRFITDRSGSITLEKLSDSCDLLVRAGDICEGENGFLAAAPTRLLSLANGETRLLGSIPLRNLELASDMQMAINGPVRLISCSRNFASLAEHMQKNYSAVVISDKAWSGLDRVCRPAALIEQLNEQSTCDMLAETAGSFEYPNPWKNYRPAADIPNGKRWQITEKVVYSRLWKTMNRWQRSVFAWSEKSPNNGNWSRISRDTATRATYALSFASAAPVRATLLQQGNSSIIELPGYLPLAEYRYISLHGQVETTGKGGIRIEVSQPGLPEVLKILQDNLGLEIDSLQQKTGEAV